ncbi:MAG: M23 family metallopeptidase [Deltaproteobacteria bacterium]|nr:M23 family metallopeptidase [Deltaproteobacteria bacterium]MBN2673141.1 M23 family metallopeptidase [Deltaproteobacteria bacterium]
MKMSIAMVLGLGVAAAVWSVAVTAENQDEEVVQQVSGVSILYMYEAVQYSGQAVAEGLEEVAANAVRPSVHLTDAQRFMLNCPVADTFVFPVGAPDAGGYYDAQPFGKNFHLGEDWNGVGGGDSDLGDPIYAVANGVVFFTEDIQLGWGNVVRILHNIGSKEAPEYIDSLYAHLIDVYVRPGAMVKKGDPIGTMGNCDGLYAAHLHFEMRHKAFMPIGGAYSVKTDGYLNPTLFLKAHSHTHGTAAQ